MPGSAGPPPRSIWREQKEVWVCRICGPHPESHRNWCGAGCGRDYNEMVEYVPREQSDALADSLRRIVDVLDYCLGSDDRNSSEWAEEVAAIETAEARLNSYREATAGEDGHGD